MANLIAIPWVEMITVPMCLLSTLLTLVNATMGQIFFHFTILLLAPLWLFLKYLSSWQYVMWYHAMPSCFILMTSFMAAFLLLLPRGWPTRWMGVVWALPLFFPKLPSPEVGDIWLTVLDVGQGLSSVIRTAHHVLIYDTGPQFPNGFDAGEQVVLPFLRYSGIHFVDRMVISHGDNDHIGGSGSVLKSMSVGDVLTSVPNRFPTHRAWSCHEGQTWIWDRVTFEMLSPENGTPYEGNNSSCVLRVSHGHQAILLTGDIEKPQERWLLTHEGSPLRSTVMIAPHHGSRTSSSAAFVRAVSPRYVLFPVGYYNRYHFPASVVQQRYRVIGARTLSTAKSGAICLRLSTDDTMVVNVVDQQQYFWQRK